MTQRVPSLSPQETKPPARVLVVEDESIVAVDIEEKLEQLGYAAAGHEATADGAISKAEELRPDLVLMDVRLRGSGDGIDAAKAIRQSFGLPVVFLTAHGDRDTMERIKATDPFGYLLKPFGAKDLMTVIEIALYRHQMEQRLRAAQETILELSTPVLPLDEGLLLVPLIGAMTPERTEYFSSTLLTAVAQKRARAVVLDLTGLGHIGHDFAARLVRVLEAAALLGARSILCGISPGLARELVELGLPSESLAIAGDLLSAIEQARARLRR